MRRRPSTTALVVALGLAGTALTAAACGSGTAQVVGTAPGGAHAAVAPHTTMQVAPPTPVPSGSTTPATAPTGGTTPSAPGAQPVAPPVSPAAISQLNIDLGSLGQNLDQVDNDLAHAQGDQ